MITTAFTVSKVIIACCANVFLLEAISKEAPGSANLITFAQFLCVALQGLISHIFYHRTRVIPLSEYAKLVILFFFVSTSNNYALNFNISVPLHVIFKSGSLLANLVLGIVILRRKYSLEKYAGVFLITLGIILCTISSYESPSSDDTEADLQHLHTWFIGILIMSIALFMSAYMGVFQETLYSRYGKHHEEALFYCHLLPLPGFLLLWPDLKSQIKVFVQSKPLDVIFFSQPIPRLLFYLYLNSVTQLICISSVFQLTCRHTSLTVTLVITLRKFFSLIISTIYFNNYFTLNHWIGAFLVFFGTLLFSEFHKQITSKLKGKTKSE